MYVAPRGLSGTLRTDAAVFEVPPNVGFFVIIGFDRSFGVSYFGSFSLWYDPTGVAHAFEPGSDPGSVGDLVGRGPRPWGVAGWGKGGRGTLTLASASSSPLPRAPQTRPSNTRSGRSSACGASSSSWRGVRWPHPTAMVGFVRMEPARTHRETRKVKFCPFAQLIGKKKIKKYY